MMSTLAADLILSSLGTAFEGLNEDPVIASHPDEIAEILAEIEDRNNDVRESESALDDLTVAAEHLDRLAVTLESIRSQGGLDSKGAELLRVSTQIAISSMPEKVKEYFNDPTRCKLVPCTESIKFGDLKDKVQATFEAETTFKETAKRIGAGAWNAVKAFFKSIWTWLITIGKGVGALTRSGEAIVERASKAGAVKSSVGEIDVSSFAKYLKVGDRIDPKGAIELCVGSTRKISEVSKSCVEAFSQGLNGGKTSDEIKALVKAKADAAKGLESTKLPGVYTVKVTEKDGVNILSIASEGKVEGEFKEKPLPLANISVIGKAIVNMATEVAKRGEVYGNEIKSLDEKLKPNEDANQKDSYGSLIAIVRGLVAGIKSGVDLSNSVMKAAYGYAGKHLSCYEGSWSGDNNNDLTVPSGRQKINGGFDDPKDNKDGKKE